MKEISLNDYLDHNNPWVSRLLGDKPFQKTRDIAQIEREYDKDFYAKRLEKYLDDPQNFVWEILNGGSRECSFSVGDRIFKGPSSVYVQMKRSAFLETLNEFSCIGELCELGAGNGQNLLWLKERQGRPLYGGEYSKNAVKLAYQMGFEVQTFNFYVQDDYEFIRPESTVFTFHAIEQIPDAACIIQNLKRQRGKISRVIHFEPLYREDRKDLLGRLRNRYTEINDYNRNLLDCLVADKDIEIEKVEKDLLGGNPLNPASIIVWRFR